MRDFLLGSSAVEMMLAGLVFFAALYLVSGACNWLLTHRLLPARGVGRMLDTRPLPPGQLRRELGLSGVSVLIFGIGALFPWGLLQLGWARLAVDPSGARIAVEIVLLLAWNEVHFYITHRLLHTPLLRRFHLPHHRSVRTTPWSTYSMHPLEAMMLGDVILLPMLMHDFSAEALVALPVFSILINSLGHSNYAAGPRWLAAAARRHQLHHACYQGNYGFMSPLLDRWLGTSLPDEAEHPRAS